MNSKILIIVVVLLVIGGVVLLMNQQQTPKQQTQQPAEQTVPTTQEQTTPAEDQSTSGEVGSDSARAKVNVEIKNFTFGPKTITLKKGTTVTFTNRDAVGHSATADDGSFDTEVLAQNESGSVTFDKVGTFAYHCTPHPYMKAQVVVE